jgi:uncharacterized protein involved in exopolysaccharide biosynthesis
VGHASQMLYPKLPQLVIARVSRAALQGALRGLLQDALSSQEAVSVIRGARATINRSRGWRFISPAVALMELLS